MASWAAVAKRNIKDRPPDSNRHTLPVRNGAEHIGRKTPSKFRPPEKTARRLLTPLKSLPHVSKTPRTQEQVPRYNAANPVRPVFNERALKPGYHAASPVSPAFNVQAHKTSSHPLGNPSAKRPQAQRKKLSYADMLATTSEKKSGLPTPRRGIRERRVLSQLNIKPKLMTPGHETPSPLAMGRAHKSRHEVPNEFHIEKLQLDIDTEHLKINIQRLLSEYQGPKDFGTLEFAFFLEVDSNRDRNLIVILSSSKPRHPSFRRLKEWFLNTNIKELVKHTFDRYYNLHTIKVSDSKQMNNEWAFKFFEKTIIHSANKLLKKDRQMIINCRQLNRRFENIAPKFKSMFQDIIKGTYSPRNTYRDTDRISNLELYLQQYAEQLFEFRSQDFIAQPRETVIRCIKTASKLFGVNPLCAEKNRFYLTAKLVHGTPSSTFYELLGREQIPVQFAFTQTDLKAIPPCCSCSICIQGNEDTIEGKNSAPAIVREHQVFESPTRQGSGGKENQSPEILPDLPVGPYSGAGPDNGEQRHSKKRHSTRRRDFNRQSLNDVRSQLSFK